MGTCQQVAACAAAGEACNDMLGCCTDEGAITCQDSVCKAVTTSSRGNGGSDTGAIIGGVVGGAVGGLLIAAIAVLLALLLRQRYKRRKLKQAYSEIGTGGLTRPMPVRCTRLGHILVPA